jgi:Trk-type K+ transport system membrane component
MSFLVAVRVYARVMTTRARELVGDVSSVVLGAALTIRGVHDGRPVSTVIGIGLLGLVVVVQIVLTLVKRSGKRPDSPTLARFVKWGERLATDRKARRRYVVLMGVGVIGFGVSCIVAAVDGNWFSCLFAGVAAVAAAGMSFGFTAHVGDDAELIVIR